MTMAAILGDMACLASYGVLRAKGPSPDATDSAGGPVFATYRLGGWYGHQCCMWTDGLQNTTFSPVPTM